MKYTLHVFASIALVETASNGRCRLTIAKVVRSQLEFYRIVVGLLHWSS